MTRQKILITGASSGLGAGMARAFAAKGRDLALCARRTRPARRTQGRADSSVIPASPSPSQRSTSTTTNRCRRCSPSCPTSWAASTASIVNAGIGKGAPLGSGKLWANKATIETNLVAALVQIETAIEMFKQAGGGHLVLISSVLGNKGVPGVKAAYAASKAGVSSLGESLRAEFANGPIKVTVLEPGYIESEMTAKSASTMLMVDNETGVKAMVDAIERETGRAAVPRWPWAPLVQLIKVLPPAAGQTFCLADLKV